jgi:Lon protease-like protein
MTMPASADDPAPSRTGEHGAGWLEDVPLFPLGTVLFPGGVLPLRIFEARYMDMVRACMQSGSPFGVCMITRGSEVGAAADHEALGCLANIIDWDMEQLGLLQIRARGGQRFEALERRVQRDGLVRARIRLIAPDTDAEVPAPFVVLAQLLRRIVGDLVEREANPLNRMVAEPYAYDSAVWVSNRLCEFLPIPMKARQKLMELSDPMARLSLVRQFLEQRQVI